MHVFISHISEEALEARALKQSLEVAIPGIEVFVSPDNIHLGETWLLKIKNALQQTKIILTLCSPQSVRRPWINFESGSGWSKKLLVIPICFKGLFKDQLPDPLGIFQIIELTNKNNCLSLIRQIATHLNLAEADTFDPMLMLKGMEVKRPIRSKQVGIVLCYGQNEWEEGEQNILNLKLFEEQKFKDLYDIIPIKEKKYFLSPDLHQHSGIILAMPWRNKLEPETITAIVEWVKEGGRLLLLGYELGDRHHDGNIAELSHYFGIDPAADIVGPSGFGNRKPYEEPVEFHIEDAEVHPFTADIDSIHLANVQTIRVDPGGIEWLKTGNNNIYRPKRDSVRYRNNTMTAPGGSAFDIYQAPQMAAAVQAPQGLCGKGEVNMIGTWDLLGRNKEFGENNIKLLVRLLDWLSGKAA
jgi:hypothetical protein